MRGARSAAAGVALAAALAACGGCRPPAASEPRRPNLLVVLLDTLRADHVGVYGYPRDTTPNLDAFAREGVVFTDNRSQSSCTWPSVNSLMTSRWPQLFWGREFGLMGIPEEIPSLATILAAEGYATAAVSASSVVRATPSWANSEGGFDRGFSIFDEACSQDDDAACVNRRALGLLGLIRQPFFLYLHYMDTHGPYRPPEDWPHRFAGDDSGLDEWVRGGTVMRLARSVYQDEPLDWEPADLAHLVDLYDDELAHFDHRFGELIAAVRDLGLLDDTLIVFLSDHGESFLENEHVVHCRSTYDSEVRVPLIVRLPGTGDGRREDGGPLRIDRPVANLDLVPTVLDYLGVDAGGHRFDGRSLRPLIEGTAAGADPPVYSVIKSLRSVTDGRFKLIEDLAGETPPRLFDLDGDPAERSDVLTGHRRDYARLAAELTEWLEEAEPGARTPRMRRRADEAIEQLRAVGYLQ